MQTGRYTSEVVLDLLYSKLEKKLYVNLRRELFYSIKIENEYKIFVVVAHLLQLVIWCDVCSEMLF